MSKQSSRITRRGFIQKTMGGLVAGAAGVAGRDAAEAAKPKIPLRPLGKTGVDVSIYGLGGGQQFLAALPEDLDEAEQAAVEFMATAVEGGMTYFDTAHNYTRRGGADGLSETLYGKGLKPHRDRIFLTTKTGQRTRDGALREYETSLKRFDLPSVDLLQLHLIRADDDLEAINGKTGALQAFRELKDQKAIRFFGITSHLTAPHTKRLVDLAEGLDTVLMPINASRDQRQGGRVDPTSDNPEGQFEKMLLPHCVDKGIGVIAMKCAGAGRLIGEGPGKSDAQTLIRYAMSTEGVATTVVGPGSLENLKSNMKMAQSFEPMKTDERNALVAHVSGSYTRFAYLESGYEDV
jgi:aryl-alcohol dehydrogenase-like predicted oxidoreductase